MEFVTWQVAAGFVASVGTICLTVYKLISDRRKKDDPEILKRLKALENARAETCAVRAEQIAELRKNQDRLQNYLDRLNASLFKLLTED